MLIDDKIIDRKEKRLFKTFRKYTRMNIISLMKSINYLESGETKLNDSDIIWIKTDLESMNLIHMMMIHSKLRKINDKKLGERLGYDLTHESHDR